MYHASCRDQHDSGLEVMMHDIPLQQVTRIAIDTALMSRLWRDDVSCILSSRAVTDRRQDKTPQPRSKSTDVQSRSLPRQKSQRTANPVERHCAVVDIPLETLLACVAAPLSCPRSLTRTALLMRLRDLSTVATEYWSMCKAFRPVSSVCTKKI